MSPNLSIPKRALAAGMRRWPRGPWRLQAGWDRLYQTLGGGGWFAEPAVDARWPPGLQGPVRNRRFGYEVWLDLQIFSERRTYFTGVCPQEDFEYLYPRILRPGDQYIDGGSNIGLTTLMASSLIGPEGRGLAFEPNRWLFGRLDQHLRHNRAVN